jgi:hypothetical protein
MCQPLLGGHRIPGSALLPAIRWCWRIALAVRPYARISVAGVWRALTVAGADGVHAALGLFQLVLSTRAETFDGGIGPRTGISTPAVVTT